MTDPIKNRRQLLAELKRLRSAAGLNQRQVAHALDWSPSKVHRIEKGDVSISVSDLKSLLNHYEIRDVELVDSLVDLARGARGRQLPFSDFNDLLPRDTIRFFGYESSASRISEVELLVVPGLLQTADYTRALLGAYGLDEAKIERFVHSREARQAVFTVDRPPRMSFIVDESVLRRAIGGPSVMTRQLDHLLAANELPNVSVQVLPFSSGAHAGLRGPFVLLEFPDSQDPDVVYIEHRRGDSIFRDEPPVIEAHKLIIRELQHLASPPAALKKYVERALDDLGGI